MKNKAVLIMAAAVLVFTMLSSCEIRTVGRPERTALTTFSDSGLSSSESKSEGCLLYPAALDIAAGKSITLCAETDETTLMWSSSNPSVASVDQNGTLSALASGEAVITASAGSGSGSCRVTVTGNVPTLAYQEDPGPVNENGKHVSTNNRTDNIPLMLPDDHNSIDKDLFKDREYAWQIIINDGFDANVNNPMAGFSYMANFHIALDAHRSGGDSILGNYEGTMEMKTSIDESSFLSAMQSAGIPATDMNSAIQIRTVNVNFELVTYDLDKIYAAKYAFAPSGTLPVIPLVQIPAMAISSAQTSTSQNMDLQVENGYGYGSMQDASGNIPIVVEVGSNGDAVLYLPKMLQMVERDSFCGTLVKLRIVDFNK